MLKRLFNKKKVTPETKRSATPVHQRSSAISRDYALGYGADTYKESSRHCDSSDDSSSYKSSGYDSYSDSSSSSSSSDDGGGGGSD